MFLACEYFEEEVIHFNPELNTIIGGRGTGKSLIIEILSYILGEYPDHNFYSLREYIHKLNTIINPMEKFAIEFRDETGDIYRLTRIFDKLPEINSPDENWQEKLDGYDEENPQKFEKKIEGEFIKKDGNEEWRNYLNINLYTQSSVANIGKDAESNLISTIDNFSHLSSKREAFLLAKEELKSTKREIEGLEEKILEIYNDLDELSEIEDMISGKNIEINDIEKKISDPKIIHIGHLKEQNTKIKNFLNEIEGYTFPEYIPLPELKFVEGLEIELLDQIQRKFEQTKENYSNQCKEKEQFQKVILDFEDWLRKNWKDTYGNEIEKLGEENFESESSEAKLNEILNDKKEQRDKLIKKQIQNQDNLKKVQDLFAKRKDLIVKLKALNEEIFNFRERICRKIEGRMEVSNHRLSMKKDYNTTETIEILGEILYKITDKLTKIKIILKELNPYELVEIIQNPEESTDLIKKLNELNITPTTIERLTKYNYKNEVLSEFKIDELILHLERVLFNQKVLFEYKKNEKWRTITSLSPGEKCSSLMHLLLAQSNQILIIDQPEDELDYSSRSDLVKCIKERKEDRQIILVTHFQNIPVIADSDMIFLMEEDNKKSKIKKKGCFEKMILPIFQMEGGFEAIKLRYKKYSSKLEEEFLLETELEDAIRFGNNKQYNKALNILENIVIRSKEIGIKDISKRAIKKMEEYRKSINDL